MRKRTQEFDRYVGQRIQGLRVERGKSQKDLADLFGISHQQWQKYEVGQSGISTDRLLYLARYFDVDVEHFWLGYSSSELFAEEPAEFRRLRLEAGRALARVHDKRVIRQILEVVQAHIAYVDGAGSPVAN
jgi:transcriptional regulator with XRE-family HTH domain